MAENGFREELSGCVSFLLKNGMLLTALELRQELVELHPEVDVPEELDSFLAKAEADALDDITDSTIASKNCVTAEIRFDTSAVDAVTHAFGGSPPVSGTRSPYGPSPRGPGLEDDADSQLSASAPPSVGAHTSAAYMEYRLRILEEELAVAKDELAIQCRRGRTTASEKSMEPNKEDEDKESASKPDDDDSGTELSATETAALNDMVRKHLIEQGHAGLAVALEGQDDLLRSDARHETTLKALYRKHGCVNAELRAEIDRQREQIQELMEEREAKKGEAEEIQHTPEPEAPPAHVALAVEKTKPESEVATRQYSKAFGSPPVAPGTVAPDLHSIFDATREALKGVKSDDNGASSILLVMRRCLPLIAPALSSTHRVLMVPLLVLAIATTSQGGESAAALGIAAASTRRLISALVRLFGTDPTLLNQRLCITGALALLCSHLSEDRLDAEVVMALVGDRAAKPVVRSLLAECLGIACASAGIRGIACSSLCYSRCMPRFVELVNDLDPNVRVAAVLGVGRILPQLGILNVAIDTEPLSQIMLTAVLADDVQMLSAAHRLLQQLQVGLCASPLWGMRLWVQLLPMIARVFHCQRPDATSGIAVSLRLALLFELFCVFTTSFVHAVDSFAARATGDGASRKSTVTEDVVADNRIRIFSDSDGGDGSKRSSLADSDFGLSDEQIQRLSVANFGTSITEAIAQDDEQSCRMAWLPSETDKLWASLLPLNLVESREEEQWSALCNLGCIEAASGRSKKLTPNAVLENFATRFSETHVDTQGQVHRSFLDSISFGQPSQSVPDRPPSPPPECGRRMTDHSLPEMPVASPCPAVPDDDLQESENAPSEAMRGSNVWSSARQFVFDNKQGAQIAQSARQFVFDNQAGGQIAQWARSAASEVGGAIASLENRTRADTLQEMMDSPDLQLQERLANARALAASVSEAPIGELLRTIDRVTAHFDMDDIREAEVHFGEETQAVTAYLPKMLDGQQVLEAAGENMWLLSRSTPGDRPGVRYRREKHLDAIMSNEHFLRWGESTQGFDEGDGWVRVQLQKGGCATPAPMLNTAPKMRQLEPPPLHDGLFTKDGTAIAKDGGHGATLLAWLASELLPFALDVATKVEWKSPTNEVALVSATHWLSLLSTTLGASFFDAVALRQMRSVLLHMLERGTPSSNGVQEVASEEFVVPCAPLSLLCCHVVSSTAGCDRAVQSFGLRALRSCAAAEFGWDRHNRSSIELLQAIWRRLASITSTAPTACLTALWPEAHHEDPRIRLAAATALGAVAVEAALVAGPPVVRRMAEAMLTLGADEDRVVLVRAIEVLGDFWLASPPGEVARQLTIYFDRLVERGDPELLLVATRIFARAAMDLPLPASGGGGILETVILPHLNYMAFEGGLRHHHALQASIAEALLAAALRRPPLPRDVCENLVLPAVREQIRKLPDTADRLQEAIRQLKTAF